jgi:hypothetical protein
MMPAWFVVLAVGAFLLLLLAGGIALVLVIVLRPGRRRAYSPDDGLSPLERAQAAAAALSPREWDEFRGWVAEQRTPPPHGGEGIRK